MSGKSDKVKMRCPECNQFMFETQKNDGTVVSTCPNCKSIVFTTEHKGKEKFIKIKFNQAK